MKLKTTLLLLTVFGSGLAYPSFASQYEPVIDAKPRLDIVALYMFPGWFKPMCDQQSYRGCSRLVLKLAKDGKAILNPKDEGFGLSSGNIELKGLALSDAQRVWGKGRTSGAYQITFDVLTERQPERDIYRLDVRFEDKVLSSYRVRGLGISLPEWTVPN
jgi:hypothetical protein